MRQSIWVPPESGPHGGSQQDEKDERDKIYIYFLGEERGEYKVEGCYEECYSEP